jgi:hypothetical protein
MTSPSTIGAWLTLVAEVEGRRPVFAKFAEDWAIKDVKKDPDIKKTLVII